MLKKIKFWLEVIRFHFHRKVLHDDWLYPDEIDWFRDIERFPFDDDDDDDLVI